MKKLQIDPLSYYLVAFLMSIVLAMFVASFASARLPIPDDDGAILGVLAFCFFIFFDLFVMYHIWSERRPGENRVAAKRLALLTVGGLLVASGVGLLLRFLSRFPLEGLAAFFGSFLVMQGIASFVDFWRNRRNPDPTIPRWNGWRFFAFMDGIGFLCGSYMLIRAWRESPALAAKEMALCLLVLAIPFAYLRWRARQGGQTPGSNPPAVRPLT